MLLLRKATWQMSYCYIIYALKIILGRYSLLRYIGLHYGNNTFPYIIEGTPLPANTWLASSIGGGLVCALCMLQGIKSTQVIVLVSLLQLMI